MKIPPAVAPRPYTVASEMLMLVVCQLGDTWFTTLSSFAIRIPVAPTTRAFHFMVLEFSENGALMMFHSSSPMVLTAVPKEPAKDFDWVFGAGGGSGSAASASTMGVAVLASSGPSSARAFSHPGS